MVRSHKTMWDQPTMCWLGVTWQLFLCDCDQRPWGHCMPQSTALGWSYIVPELVNFDSDWMLFPKNIHNLFKIAIRWICKHIAQIPYFTFEEWLCADPQCWHSLTCRPWPPATDGITPSKALSCSVPAPGYLGQGQIYATALLLNCTLPLHSSPTATWRVCLWLGGSSHATS